MITWSEIEAECGDYRAGFVAIFRKYEGQPTDEKDEQGRTVKVNISSFARHAGIPDTTFRRWVDFTDPGKLPDVRGAERGALSRVRNLPTEDRAKLASELLAEPEVAAQVLDDNTARLAVRQALNERYEKAPKPYEGRTEFAPPHDHAITVLVRLRAISAAIKAATDEILSGPQIEGADDLLAVIDWQANALNIIRTALTGRSDMDAELAKILENGS